MMNYTKDVLFRGLWLNDVFYCPIVYLNTKLDNINMLGTNFFVLQASSQNGLYSVCSEKLFN